MIVFMILYMYIARGQGQTAPRGQNFDVNFIHVLQVSKKSLISYNFSHDLIYVYIPEAEADSPQGIKI